MTTLRSTPTPVLDDDRMRFPTLLEVLNRETRPPIDLFSYYIYMRDQQRAVDYLDFWLDVSQHLSLCRHYVRELRRSVLIDTPDLENSRSKRSSALLEKFAPNETRGSEPAVGPSGQTVYSEKGASGADQTVSSYLRSENPKLSPHGSHDSNNGSRNDSTSDSSRSRERQARPSFGAGRSNKNGNVSGNNNTSSDTTPPTGQQSSSPGHTVTRLDIRSSAEKILYTFLLPGAEREIILPQAILNDIQDSIEEQGRDDPEVFDVAKDYVFQAMERDAFRPFLKAKGLGNLVPPSMMIRLVAGMISLFAALWAAFVLIFLNYSRQPRCWLILPFSIALYCIVSHQYMTDPLVVFAGYSEYTFMSFHRMKEPFVVKTLRRRALMAVLWIVLITAVLCCLFILVPGKRL